MASCPQAPPTRNIVLNPSCSPCTSTLHMFPVLSHDCLLYPSPNPSSTPYPAPYPHPLLTLPPSLPTPPFSNSPPTHPLPTPRPTLQTITYLLPNSSQPLTPGKVAALVPRLTIFFELAKAG